MDNDIYYGSLQNPIKSSDIETRQKLLGTNNIVVTHDGKYHDDDLFAAAMFDIYYDGNLKIKRTRDVKPIADYESEIRRNNPELNRQINERAKEMTEYDEDIDRYNKIRKRNYYKELRKEAYDSHNKQPIPFLLENGKIVYFEADYLFDVGYGELDHHDNLETGEKYWNYRTDKPDIQYWNKDSYTKFGVKYAAAGLTWQKFGKEVIKKALSSHRKLKAFAFDEEMVDEVFRSVDEELISIIDYKDNANKGEYNFNSEKYRAITNQVRNIIDFDYEDDEFYVEGKTPFETGVNYLSNRFLKSEIRRTTNEVLDARRYETLFNDAVDNCTNEARVIEFDTNFKYSSLAKKNKKSRFINFVIMKENDGDKYLIKFHQKGEYSIASKPFLDHWEVGYNGIAHLNDTFKVVSVDSLNEARELVNEFYNYYAHEMDKTDYKMDSMKTIENDIMGNLNKSKEKILNSLNGSIYKYEKALEVLRNSIQVSAREGRIDELLEQIKYHENKIKELKLEHNDLSKDLDKPLRYEELIPKEIDEKEEAKAKDTDELSI